MNEYNFPKSILISSLIIFSMYFLWKSGFFYSYSFFPVIFKDQFYIFADWGTMIRLNICNKLGINVFYNNPCASGIMDYGNIFLFIPFFKFLEKFYFFYFPILAVIIFVFSVVSLIQPKNIFNYFLLILILFSPSTLLIIERANFDMFIFLMIVLIAFVNLPFLNFIIIIIASLTKYYPLTLIVNFFIEKNRSIEKILLILLLFIIIFLSLFYLSGDSLKLIQHKMQSFDPPWGNQFSVMAFQIILKKWKNYEHFSILFSSYLFFIFSTITFFWFFKKTYFVKKINIYLFKERLFLLGANLIVPVYLISNNIHYREIFIILLFPLLLKLKDIIDYKIFKYLIYFVVLRYIFFLISNYFIFFKKIYFLLLIKAFSDLILMSIFAAICLILNYEILKKIKFKV